MAHLLATHSDRLVFPELVLDASVWIRFVGRWCGDVQPASQPDFFSSDELEGRVVNLGVFVRVRWVFGGWLGSPNRSK